MINRNIVTERDAAFRRGVQGGDSTASADRYLERLVKLIPAEIILAFAAAEGVVASWHTSARFQAIAAWGCFVVILLALPAYLKRVAEIRRGKQIFASAIAYVAWAAGSAGPPFGLDPEPRALILILGGFLLPLVRIGPPSDDASG
jgi:hypothetical protein